MARKRRLGTLAAVLDFPIAEYGRQRGNTSPKTRVRSPAYSVTIPGPGGWK